MGVAGAVVGAQVAMAAASAIQQSSAAKSQANISKAEATITHAQQEHELARTASTQSEEFRRGLASTVASASARGGVGMARQFGSQALSSYAQDMEAIKRAYKFNDLQKQNKIAQANALASSGGLGAILGFGKSVVGSGSTYSNTKAIEGILKQGKSSTPAPVVESVAKFTPNVPYAPTSNIAGTITGKYDPLGKSILG